LEWAFIKYIAASPKSAPRRLSAVRPEREFEVAGLLYRGEDHPTEALATILDGIHGWASSEDGTYPTRSSA
jgi:hypothetical protein